MFIHKTIPTICILLLIGLTALPGTAQQLYSQRQQQLSNQLSKTFQKKYTVQRANAYARALKAQLPTRIVTQGRVLELQGFSRPKNGVPLYFATFNTNAARTISTHLVQSTWNLKGRGMKLGIWDAGRVRYTHWDLSTFGNPPLSKIRVFQRDNPPAGFDSHATHVAGTMIAHGMIPGSQGMAPEADLDAYDWNDDLSEMINAASNGLLLSNHSYGFLTGWSYNRSTRKWRWYGDTSISTTEDYRFGFYSDYSRNLDQISFYMPYYLICRAAGNDRAESHTGTHEYYNGNRWVSSTAIRKPDGNYDCLGAGAVAKNVLTVGAINDISNGYKQSSDVVQTSFSSWGPTDDGRIKPDIVANGASVMSTTSNSNTSYGTSSGTSMAAPSVTGSLALLQEHYKNNNGNRVMRAATLKALVIHTADEAGIANGPDYQNGWGLMNTKAAADVIDRRNISTKIEERLLQKNTSQSIRVKVSAGSTKPLVVTLAWTDIAGTPAAPALDPSKRMLVNDLDIRLFHVISRRTYMPWQLDPNYPRKAATKGDNDRDNVEKIEIAVPQSGEYHIIVTHKQGFVGNRQSYSLIVSGISPDGVCETPRGLSVTDRTSSSALLHWNEAAGVQFYSVRYRKYRTYAWTHKTSTVNHLQVANLDNGSQYEFQVRTFCNNRFQPYSTIHRFRASGCVRTLPYEESFEAGSSWSQYNGFRSIKWTRLSGRSSGANTGPSRARHENYYACLRSAFPNYPNKTGIFTSPCLDIRNVNNPVLKFYYHMYGAHVNRLVLEVSTNSGNSWTQIFSKSGDQGNSWKEAAIDLSAYKASRVLLRFVGTTGAGPRGDIAIDHIRVQDSKYCVPKNINTNLEYIQKVKFADINHSSGNNNGYANFIAQSTKIAREDFAKITITPAWTGSIHHEGYMVWIDFNQDGDFFDPGEAVLSVGRTQNTPVIGTISIPSGAMLGKTRMRVAMMYNGRPYTPCLQSDYGEVEDYTLEISPKGTTNFQGTAIQFQEQASNLDPTDIVVFPNPTSHQVTIQAKTKNNEQVRFTLINAMGTQLQAKSAQAQNGVATQSFQVNQYTKGVYFIKILTPGTQKVKKIIIK